MKRFARLFVVTLGLAILGLVVTLVPHKDANAQAPTQVQVVNTPLPVTVRGIAQGAPLQVTGGVTVANTPLPVSVPGIVNVLTPGRSSLRVAVTNTPLPVSGTVGLASGSEVIMPTHLGVLAGNLVTLRCSGFSGGKCLTFDRCDTTGVCSLFSTIPPGATLIITDLTFASFGNSASTEVEYVLQTCTPTGGCINLNITPAVANPDTSAFAVEHLTSGIALTVVPTTDMTGPAGVQLNNLIIHGYLAP
jgi:hypothetical protein